MIKTEIIRYLEAEGPKFGGQIDREMNIRLGCKESNVGRRCRELVRAGVLARELVKIEGVPNKVVRYSVAEKKEPLPCPHGRYPIDGEDGYKHCPHCLGINQVEQSEKLPL